MTIRKALHIIIIAAVAFIFAACSGGKTFEIDGQLLNMDQGTIYVYSSDGIIQNIDTIQIMGGRFEYSRNIDRKGTLVLVFPNFSEIPVFAEPGDEATLKGNAQQLNNLTVSGSEDNKLMTTFRIETFEQSPPEIQKKAEETILNNPKTTIAIWLLERYFIKIANPDYEKSLKMAKELKKVQTENGYLNELIQKLEYLAKAKNKGKLPSFSVADVKGNTIDNESLKGKKTIIYMSAQWDYNNDIDRNVKQYINSEGYNFNAVKISLDASKKVATNELEYNDVGIKIICQEKMFESPIMKTFGFYGISDNIILDAAGFMVKRNAQSSELEELLK